MTRETKIGLLVGLAFIIVVGILLSDHMAATTELPQAPLDTVATNDHKAIVTPGESTRTLPLTHVVVTNDVTPPVQIPTHEELAVTPPVQHIEVTGPQPQPTVVVTADNNNTTPPSDPRKDLVAAAHEGHEDLVDVNAHKPADLPNDPKKKTYIAQAGDNLSKITLKTMGVNNKANRDAILAANPKLAANPDRIIVGQSYAIPAAGAAPSAPVATAVLPIVVPKVDKPEKAVQPAVSGQPSVMYTVSDNDNLWRIAATQLGQGNLAMVEKIKSMNQDTLKGGDKVRVGMKLRLPTKAVAMAN